MDDFTLFYAWQSDIDAKINRYVIRDAAKDTLKKLTKDAALEESPRLDSDTQNVAGTPEVAATIFDKIDKAGLFLADVTFIGKSENDDPLPNSNVLLELGYAAARIGWERTILVMNTAFGDPDRLVFDLRHRRWPITYRLETTAPREEITKQRARLASDFAIAIRVAAQEEHSSVLNAISRLDEHCLRCLSDHAKYEYFHPSPVRTMGQVLVTQTRDAALIRLLELGVLRCDFKPAAGSYDYHWTYLGKLVLYQLRMRERPQTV